MADFTGRRILVTGASTGIGAETARRLVKAGAVVGIHYNASKAAAEELAAELEPAPGKTILLQGDLTKPQACDKVVDDFVDAAGGMDALVNNAGGMIRRCPMDEYDVALIEETYRLNVFSVMLVTKRALPHLRQAESPSIVIISSVAARTGAPSATIYATAKGALDTLTRGMARELAPAIRVNAVAPGVIATPFHEKVSTPEQMENMRKGIPLERHGVAVEIAPAILHLLSDDASYITGETIDVNGGMFMR